MNKGRNKFKNIHNMPFRTSDEARLKQKIIDTYIDLKYGCEVKVLESHQEPYRTRPTGYEEW